MQNWFKTYFVSLKIFPHKDTNMLKKKNPNQQIPREYYLSGYGV